MMRRIFLFIAPFLKALRRHRLPSSFEAPLHFLLTGQLCEEDRARVEYIETMRAQLARQQTSHRIVFPSYIKEDACLSAASLAHQASVTREWGTFLLLYARAVKARTILELGACAGISGCYLASASTCERFLTVEGSPSLAAVAEGHLRRIGPHASVLNLTFDEAIDRLDTWCSYVDLVYIDGQHTQEARFHYFQRLLPYLRAGSTVVFDDIHWSEEMWQTWAMLQRFPGWACTVNAGRFGIGIWGDGEHPIMSYDVSLWTGWSRIGNALSGFRRKTPRELYRAIL
jgi:predicted O-methyltransferase YrrM